MFETLDKIMMAGIGALSMTREKAEEIFDELVNQGKAAKEGRSKFVQKMLDSAEKSRTEFEKVLSKQIDKAMERLNLATREDIKRLEKKLDKLHGKE